MAFDITQTLEIIPAAIIGLTVHEFSHAYMAYKLGDATAKEDGRVSLNPLKHIDWLGFFLIIIAGFGWAKPVMFNPENLKNKHRDEILISLAGPFSNFLLSILFFGVARVLYAIPSMPVSEMGIFTINLLVIWGIINLGLFVFNLIPIPPLDGSHLYITFLQDNNPQLMTVLYKYGTIGLLVVIVAENQLNINILHLSDFIDFFSGWMFRILHF